MPHRPSAQIQAAIDETPASKKPRTDDGPSDESGSGTKQAAELTDTVMESGAVEGASVSALEPLAANSMYDASRPERQSSPNDTSDEG